jgi:hypothetical protein
MIRESEEHISWLKSLKVGDRVEVRPFTNDGLGYCFTSRVTAVVRGAVDVDWSPAAKDGDVQRFSTKTGKEKEARTKRNYITKP